MYNNNIAYSQYSIVILSNKDMPYFLSAQICHFDLNFCLKVDGSKACFWLLSDFQKISFMVMILLFPQ